MIESITNPKVLVIETKPQNVTKIRSQGEVGWSEDMDVRFAQHQVQDSIPVA
jgi:hypothetical protein